MADGKNDITIKIGADTYQLEKRLDEAAQSLDVLETAAAAKAASYTQYAIKYGLLTKALALSRPLIAPIATATFALAKQFGFLRIATIAATSAILPWHAAAMAAHTVLKPFDGMLGRVSLSVQSVGRAVEAGGRSMHAFGVSIAAVGARVAAFGATVVAAGTTLSQARGPLSALGPVLAGLGTAFVVVGTAVSRFTGLFPALGLVVGRIGEAIGALGISISGMTAFIAHSLLSVARWHVILLAVAQVFHVLIDGIKQANKQFRELEDVGKLQDTLKTSFEFADQLAGAFRQAGVSTKDLNKALETLSYNIATGLGDPANDVTTVFRGMGIATTDAEGRLRNMAEILPLLADRLKGYADDGRRAQLMTLLFGKELGEKLLPILKQGSFHLHNLQVAAGQTFTEEHLQRIKDHKETTERLQKLYKALVDTVSVGVTGAYNQWEKVLAGIMKWMKPLTDELTYQLELFARGAPSTWVAEMKRVEDEIERVEEQLENMNDWQEQVLRDRGSGGWQGFFAQFRDYSGHIARATKNLEELRAQLERLKIESNTGWTAVTRRQGEGDEVLPGAPTPAAVREAERKAQEEMDRIQRIATRAARLQLEAYTEMLGGSKVIFDEMNFIWVSHAEQVETATRLINNAYADQLIAAEHVAKMKRRLAMQEQKDILETATLAASTITALFPKSKAAGIAAAVINTAVGITNALSTGLPPWNWIQAGLVAASGAAQIAAIRSTSATGGGTAPTVSGGGGSEGGAAAPQSGRMITISGLRDEGRYGGSSVRGLLEQINEEVRNGGFLISTSSLSQAST